MDEKTLSTIVHSLLTPNPFRHHLYSSGGKSQAKKYPQHP